MVIHLSRSLFIYLNYLGISNAVGQESTRGHICSQEQDKSSSKVDFSWFVAFWEHQIFRIKLIEIIILWVFLQHPFWLQPVFGTFGPFFFQLLKTLCSAKDLWWEFITQKGIWSMLLIKSDLKWCIHLSKRLFYICMMHPNLCRRV